MLAPIFEGRDQLEGKVTKNKYHIKFPFDCNNCCVVAYLLPYLLI